MFEGIYENMRYMIRIMLCFYFILFIYYYFLRRWVRRKGTKKKKASFLNLRDYLI